MFSPEFDYNSLSSSSSSNHHDGVERVRASVCVYSSANKLRQMAIALSS